MIYISGASGFIGKVVLEELRKKRVICQKLKIRQKISNKDLSLIKRTGFKNDSILIHLGWGKMNDPWSNFHLKNNYRNSIKLFKIAKKNNFKKVIFCGSMNEYGNKYGRLKEGMAPGKLETLYAKSKLKLTNFSIKFFKNSKTSFFCVRPSYVYGPHQREGTLIDLLIKAFKKKNSIKMTKCMSYRDYVYVDDVAKGIVKIALVKKKIEKGIYNLGSGKSLTIKNFIKIFCKIIKFNDKFLKFGAIPEKKEQKQLKSYLDCIKIRKNLNWSPNSNIKIGLSKIAKFIL
jgi:nucleoside-diphosphate-sugar epimerase